MSQASEDFDKFLKQREEASTAFVNGDFDPLGQVSSEVSPATIFGPKGDCVQDAKNVNAANAKTAKLFKASSKNAFEILHKGASDSLAYWVGIQRSVVQMDGQKEDIPMDLRITEIFRRENGLWKLFHRHADTLKPDGSA